MNGITSLMQGPQGQGGPMQGPMPGQAPQQPMPGMMPQQGAPTPGAMTGSLKNMELDQLKMMYMNPQPNSPPLWAVISALAEKQKEAQAMQMAQGQQAMAQNAQMQQQPPVAAQVLQASEQMPQQQTQMAAHGGMMHGYAGGGAVSFEKGGRTYGYAPDYEESRSIGINLSPYDSAEVRQDKLRRLEEYRRTGVVPPPREKEAPEYREMGASPEEMAGQSVVQRPQSDIRKLLTPNLSALVSGIAGERPSFYSEELYGKPQKLPMPPAINVPYGRGMAEERATVQSQPEAQTSTRNQLSATTFDITNPASINALRMAAQDTSLPEAERADLQRRIAMMQSQRSTPAASTSPGMAIQGEMSPEERKTYADYRAMMEGRKVRPESLVKAEQGLGELAQANIAAQRAESERMAREAQERRNAAIGRSQRSILSDPQSLLALAGGIDTRRGQGIGSLARVAAGLLGQREASAEAARKEYATVQQAQRAMEAAIRQTQMLEAQRQVAVETNKYDLVNQLDEKIAQSRMAEQAAARDVRNKSIEQARLERIATAQEVEAGAKATTAGRPTETTRTLQEFGLAPTLESLSALAGARQPVVSGERQDLAELKTLQGNLQKQVENYMIPKTQRDAAALQLQQVNAKLAQMAGIGGATVPTGGAIRPSSQAEFDALPKGARYINPADGKEYTKN